MPRYARLVRTLVVLVVSSFVATAHAQSASSDSSTTHGPAASSDSSTTHAQSASPDSSAKAAPATAPTPAPADTGRSAATHPSFAHAPDSPAAPIHPRWALVLSGGAARGIGHIGVIRALEEEGIRPGLVCGTSMGALIGALYSAGYTSAEIGQMVRESDWDKIFGREREHFEWRDTIIPQPWMELIGDGFQLHLPSGIVDDSNLNFTLATYYLHAEAMARGDFDRLPIPFRCVGSDAETTDPIVFHNGSLARAVRASISIPPLFPAVPEGNTMLVDGGLASNMPVSTARISAPDRILAVDVSLPPIDLSDRSSLLEVSFSVFDRLNKRSQQDTLSARDRLLWLKLPNYGPMDFAACDSLIEQGYREARAGVHAFAELVRADSGAAPPDSVLARRGAMSDSLPPARPEVVWLDRNGKPSPRAHIARRLFGATPAASFEPAVLKPAFERVYRADMFVSAWPSFTVKDDSTTISMNVESRPASELMFAFAYDNDFRARFNTTLVLRPLNRRLPDKISIGATFDPLRQNAFFALEPHSLARGSDGYFIRGGWRNTDIRIFDEERVVTETPVERIEGMIGLQKRLTSIYLLQAGAGYGFAGTDARDLSGMLASLRIQSGSAFGEGIETVLLAGKESYAMVIARATVDVRTGPFILRTSARAGSSSKLTPPDELQPLGGPESLVGLRRREWLGHDRIAAELRLIHDLTASARVFVYGQGGAITQTVSRPDMNRGPHFAGGAGLELNVPFGPLKVDWGIADGGEFRLDVDFGQRF